MNKNKISEKHKNALLKIGTMKEFGAFEELLRIKAHNIAMSSFKLAHKDPIERTLEHEFLKGQSYFALRLIDEIKGLVNKKEDEDKK